PYYPASTVLGSIGTSSFTGEEDGVIVTSLFNLTSTDTVTGVRVYLRSNSVAGGVLAVSIRDTAGLSSSPAIEFPIIVESDLVTLTTADISRGYIDVPIPAILAGSPQDRVLAAGPYYAGVQLFSNTGNNHIRIQDDLSNEAFMPSYTSLVYLPVDGNWYTNGTAMGLAAIFGNPSATSVQVLEANSAKVYPNPFVNEVHWSWISSMPRSLLVVMICKDACLQRAPRSTLNRGYSIIPPLSENCPWPFTAWSFGPSKGQSLPGSW
ncbi:MAG: hypothetical protein EBQ67_00310, partial [Sphingobacteriia bacterium]|nr:hypothetical protein [Sphingobacteriia bacterium]